MSEFKIFAGRNVDEAIVQAQEFYGQGREKLEIEIVSGGSTGIFGLVGKKKAEVRARVRGAGRQAPASPASPVSQDAPAPGQAAGPAEEQAQSPVQAQGEPRERRPSRSGRGERSQRGPRPERNGNGAAPAAPAAPSPTGSETPGEPRARSQGRPQGQSQSRPPSRPEPRREMTSSDYADDSLEEESRPIEDNVVAKELSEELAGIVKSVLESLLNYITETAPRIEVTGNSLRVSALVVDEANSGLIIGREGQTLAALQYLVNRIVARRWAEPVRVQINTGEYREKQDENLRKMALYLADKAKTQGRPQSTKPLSSYHRRVVHMALQEDKTVQTRSKGEGPFKKVVILPSRRGGEAKPGDEAEPGNA
ncbi:MAG: Jag N-terminal domain-containing protein [Desulfovibrionaceae bacterium]|nr:Jag N-terminal domain-containing protein [Desulfovibrionaceae bacterium]MBF0514319.1 Jag N-terminal domain-containing protein [Desulfovibrionaceae bacterium]